MKTLYLLVILFIGCMPPPQFSVFERTDAFHPGKTEFFSSLLNLSKSIQGNSFCKLRTFTDTTSTEVLYTIQILYSGNDWMFIRGLMFLCDGKPISIKPVGDPNRSVGNEFSSTRVNESQLFYLPDSVVLCVKSASEIAIRLIGENFYHEKYLDSADLGHLKFYYTFIDTGVIKKQQSTR